MNIKAEIGKNISYYRKEKEMTQRELAEKLNVCTQTVSKWEQQITCPDVVLLPEIARVLGITIDQIFDIKSHGKEEKRKRVVKKVDV